MSNVLEWIRFIASAALMLFGVFVFLSGIWGVFRFRFALNRMQTAATIDSLGAFSFLAGLLLATGWDPQLSWKLIVLIVFLWLTSPLCAHMVAKLEVWTNGELEEHMNIVDNTTGKVTQAEKEGD